MLPQSVILQKLNMSLMCSSVKAPDFCHTREECILGLSRTGRILLPLQRLMTLGIAPNRRLRLLFLAESQQERQVRLFRRLQALRFLLHKRRSDSARSVSVYSAVVCGQKRT